MAEGMEEMDDPGLAAGWVAYQDPEDGMPFYYNPETEESTWERPAGSKPLPVTRVASKRTLSPEEGSVVRSLPKSGEKPTAPPSPSSASPPGSPRVVGAGVVEGGGAGVVNGGDDGRDEEEKKKDETSVSPKPPPTAPPPSTSPSTSPHPPPLPPKTPTPPSSPPPAVRKESKEEQKMPRRKSSGFARPSAEEMLEAVKVLDAYHALEAMEKLEVEAVIARIQAKFRQRRDLRGRVKSGPKKITVITKWEKRKSGGGGGEEEAEEEEEEEEEDGVSGYVFQEKSSGLLVAVPVGSIEAVRALESSVDFVSVGPTYAVKVGAELVGLGAPGEGRTYVRVLSEFGGAEYFYDEETRDTFRTLPLGGEVVRTVRRIVSDSTRSATAKAAAKDASVALLRRLHSKRRRESVMGMVEKKAPPAKPPLAGWMFKTDPSGRHWKRRYVIVAGGLVEYFSSNPAVSLARHGVRENAIGSLDLSLEGTECRAMPKEVLAGAPAGVSAGFGVRIGERTYYFASDDRREVGRFKFRIQEELDRIAEFGKDAARAKPEERASAVISKDAAGAVVQGLLEATEADIGQPALKETAVLCSTDGHRFAKHSIALYPWVGLLVASPEEGGEGGGGSGGSGSGGGGSGGGDGGRRERVGKMERSTTAGTLALVAAKLGFSAGESRRFDGPVSVELSGRTRVVFPSTKLSPTDERRELSVDVTQTSFSGRVATLTLIFKDVELFESWLQVLQAFRFHRIPFHPLLAETEESVRTGPVNGELVKSDRSGLSWKKRFFTLDPSQVAPHLEWFEAEEQAGGKHRGVLYTDIVSDIIVGSLYADAQDPWAFTLHAREGERSLRLVADSPAALAYWIMAFLRCLDLRRHVISTAAAPEKETAQEG